MNIVPRMVAALVIGATALLILSSDDVDRYTWQSSRRRTTSSPEPLPAKEQLPQVVFNDLKYRRVCTEVYGSTLCMTLRYPFEVPLQHESVRYPSPVDDRFYQLDKPPVMLDGPLLEGCRNSTVGQQEIVGHIFHCLETVSSYHYPDQVVAVFSRRAPGQAEGFYGVVSALQRGRIFEFFRGGDDVIVVGDSMGPPAARAISDLIGTCTISDLQILDKRNTHRSHMCMTPQLNSAEDAATASERNLQVQAASPDATDTNTILLRNLWFKPDVYFSRQHNHQWHVVNETKTLLEEIKNKSFLFRGRQPNQSSKLRPLTLIFEYPFAHTQNEHMIFDSLAQIEYNQQRLVELIMNISTPAARSDLEALGFELSHMIVFDGFPQHFPTETSGFTTAPHLSQADFLAARGYDGWHPALGSSCRGPLPPNSPLTEINHQERRLFESSGFDMRWYGKSWEFTNQFWWGETMWRGGQLDCTHPRSTAEGGPQVWKYFLQAMVDGYFEDRL